MIDRERLQRAGLPPEEMRAGTGAEDEPFQFGLGELFWFVTCLGIVSFALRNIGWYLLGAWVLASLVLTVLLAPYVVWLALRTLVLGLAQVYGAVCARLVWPRRVDAVERPPGHD